MTIRWAVSVSPLPNSWMGQGVQCQSSLLKNHCRPFQEVDLEPLVGLDMPHLEHLELRAQNEEGFGVRQLEPLAMAKMPSLK